MVLNKTHVPSTLSTETKHGTEETRRSAAGSRSGSTGQQGTSGGPRPPGDAASVIGADLRAQYEVQLSALAEQYPGAQIWHHEHGYWILSRSQLLPNLKEHAIFLTGFFFPAHMVRSWAFWRSPIALPAWIGPRHTNFPDGSICAFEPSDKTWRFGDALVALLDLYTSWALRHLHLRVFGRWPGNQFVRFPGERILELKADEHCGCSQSEKLYGECCMKKDFALNQISKVLDFLWRTGGSRRPPEAVVRCVSRETDLPPLELVFPEHSSYCKTASFIQSASANLFWN